MSPPVRPASRLTSGVPESATRLLRARGSREDNASSPANIANLPASPAPTSWSLEVPQPERQSPAPFRTRAASRDARNRTASPRPPPRARCARKVRPKRTPVGSPWPGNRGFGPGERPARPSAQPRHPMPPSGEPGARGRGKLCQPPSSPGAVGNGGQFPSALTVAHRAYHHHAMTKKDYAAIAAVMTSTRGAGALCGVAEELSIVFQVENQKF